MDELLTIEEIEAYFAPDWVLIGEPQTRLSSLCYHFTLDFMPESGPAQDGFCAEGPR